jgi:hypothetical protein
MAQIDRFVIKNNVVIAGKDFLASHAMVTAFAQPKKEQALVYEGNQLIDNRGGNMYFVNIPSSNNEIKGQFRALQPGNNGSN